ncbi:DUF4269 domain-containing protein [Psychroserpens sp. NJDZ02]|uniref:DUF4269 domain-containing protein n=1 Tax=Psychroserpens sp. NJDZ02 TaxID=2570561 RepID=UPI0010A77CE9|nr:DUF4269 domain-containing protein [Psychroserpens sp. NJDZ02]QCE40180.1 DUF4269 domain-containing protein [Psychroserpens sp. NJDZ02]
MIVEYQILKEKNVEFKQRNKNLKSNGIKTETTFAQLLGVHGDPYLELFKLEN